MRAALAWARQRPLVGGALAVAAALVLFFSGRLEMGGMEVQFGLPGMQTTILPIVLALAGVLAMLLPAQHVFYGVIVLAVSLYSLVGVNLGGYIVGMLLGCVGGILVVSYLPKRIAVTSEPHTAAAAPVVTLGSEGSTPAETGTSGRRAHRAARGVAGAV